MAPPRSRIGPATDEERARVMGASPVAGDYDETIDRESAYELLDKRVERQVAQTELASQMAAAEKIRLKNEKAREKAERAASRGGRATPPVDRRGRRQDLRALYQLGAWRRASCADCSAASGVAEPRRSDLVTAPHDISRLFLTGLDRNR